MDEDRAREPGAWGDEDELDELADPDEPTEPDEPFVRPIDRFRRTTTGSVLAAGLLGLGDALENRPKQEEVVIVSEAGDPPASDWLDVELDFDDPGRSRVVIHRPAPDEPGAGEPGSGEPGSG